MHLPAEARLPSCVIALGRKDRPNGPAEIFGNTSRDIAEGGHYLYFALTNLRRLSDATSSYAPFMERFGSFTFWRGALL